MTGGGASWQPGSMIGVFQHNWQLDVLSWNDRARLRLQKCLGWTRASGQAVQTRRRGFHNSLVRLTFKFKSNLKWNPFHRRTENLSGCFRRSRARMTKCQNCSPSITRTLYCYVKDSSRWWGNVATGFFFFFNPAAPCDDITDIQRGRGLSNEALVLKAGWSTWVKC